LKGNGHGCRKDFFQGGNRFFQGYSEKESGESSFYPFEIEKTTFFDKNRKMPNFKIQVGLAPAPKHIFALKQRRRASFSHH